MNTAITTTVSNASDNINNTIADAGHVYQVPKITLKDFVELALTTRTCHRWDFMELISELQMMLKRE